MQLLKQQGALTLHITLGHMNCLSEVDHTFTKTQLRNDSHNQIVHPCTLPDSEHRRYRQCIIISSRKRADKSRFHTSFIVIQIYTKWRLAVRLGHSLQLIFLLDGIRVGGTLQYKQKKNFAIAVKIQQKRKRFIS